MTISDTFNESLALSDNAGLAALEGFYRGSLIGACHRREQVEKEVDGYLEKLQAIRREQTARDCV